MLPAFLLLLACQLAGELTVRLAALPLPGPALGMALMAGLMIARPAIAESVRPAAQGLLTHLSLLFVPAGVGVVAHLDRLGRDMPAFVVVLALSTLIALAVTAATFTLVARALERAGR